MAWNPKKLDIEARLFGREKKIFDLENEGIKIRLKNIRKQRLKARK